LTLAWVTTAHADISANYPQARDLFPKASRFADPEGEPPASAVYENDRLVGMITDRDIAVRGIAEGKGPDTPIRDVMTPDVRYCYEDEDTEHVAQNMGEQQIRRIPVLNRDKRLIGILSLGDLATRQGSRPAGETLVDVSQPGGLHNQ